jgi:predicted  nucleic acid-binding Zn-ribbon protein|tara:strand:- start:7 stop:243 length:237 start_codon:yes stop_codon:yes gene_type:complete
MSISKEQIETRKSELEKDFQMVKQQIEDSEVKVISMKNNLNALAGAMQQCDMFLKQLADDTDAPMSAEKQQALDIATS